MQSSANAQAGRERGLMIMIGIALLTSLSLGGVAAGSWMSSRGTTLGETLPRPVSAVEIASPAPEVTSTPTPLGCGAGTVAEGPVGPPAVRRRFELEDSAFSAPILANGVLFVGTWNGHLYAIDARTGAERWRQLTGSMMQQAPVLGAGLVFIGDMNATIHAIDAATGAPRWRVAMRDYPTMAFAGDALFVVSGKNNAVPAVAGDIVYVGGGNDDPIVQSLDPATGSERWRVPLSRHGLYALDAATGAERWYLETTSRVSAAPVIVGEWIYVADEALHKVDAATGREDWLIPLGKGSTVNAAMVADGRIYLDIVSPVRPTDGLRVISQWVYAFDDVSGAALWRFPTGSSAWSRSAIAGDTVYVAGDDRNLYALDAETGVERWRLDLGAHLASPLIACGVLYGNIHDGSLVAIANA